MSETDFPDLRDIPAGSGLLAVSWAPLPPEPAEGEPDRVYVDDGQMQQFLIFHDLRSAVSAGRELFAVLDDAALRKVVFCQAYEVGEQDTPPASGGWMKASVALRPADSSGTDTP